MFSLNERKAAVEEMNSCSHAPMTEIKLTIFESRFFFNPSVCTLGVLEKILLGRVSPVCQTWVTKKGAVKLVITVREELKTKQQHKSFLLPDLSLERPMASFSLTSKDWKSIKRVEP